jgi:hypothetical protein
MNKVLVCIGILLSVTLAASPATEKRPSTRNFMTMTVQDDISGQQITNGEILNEQNPLLSIMPINGGSADCFDYIMIVAGAPGRGEPRLFTQPNPPFLLPPNYNYTLSTGIGPMPANTKVTLTVSTMCSGLRVGGAVLTFYDEYKP